MNVEVCKLTCRERTCRLTYEKTEKVKHASVKAHLHNDDVGLLWKIG